MLIKRWSHGCFVAIWSPLSKMLNHFLINKGNMQFDFVKPEDVKEWVT